MGTLTAPSTCSRSNWYAGRTSRKVAPLAASRSACRGAGSGQGRRGARGRGLRRRPGARALRGLRRLAGACRAGARGGGCALRHACLSRPMSRHATCGQHWALQRTRAQGMCTMWDATLLVGPTGVRTSLGGTLFRPRLVSLAWMTGHTCRARRRAQRGRLCDPTTAERRRGAWPGRHRVRRPGLWRDDSRVALLPVLRRVLACARAPDATQSCTQKNTVLVARRGAQAAPAAKRQARGGQRTVCVALRLHAHPP